MQDAAFPLFDKVQAEHVVPGVTALVAQLNKEIDALEESVEPTWEGLVEPLERISDRLSRAWGVVSHLKVCARQPTALCLGVRSLPAVRQAKLSLLSIWFDATPTGL